MGDAESRRETLPKIYPGLQNRSVISTVLGDYHFGALTIDGQLLTWGQYSHGALGLGMPTALPVGAPGGYKTEAHLTHSRSSDWGPLLDPPNVESPAPVHFNHGPNPGGRRFCFAATAAGWHMGALVICLEPEKEVYDATSITEDQDDTPTRTSRLFRRGLQVEEPSGSHSHTAQPSDAGAFGLGRVFRIGFAGRGRGGG